MTELDLIKKKIREEMNDVADAVSTGAAPDYAMYRHMVGVIEGLAKAERHIIDIEERLLKADF